MKAEKGLHVAVGVIKDINGNILISLRHDSAHQGGLWEFPGGKVEIGETVEQAVMRELKEELGISVQQLAPLIKIKHQYTDLNVFLDVWSVTLFSGNPVGCEGQKIKWVSPEELDFYSFPKANHPIITAARLPAEYAILNAETDDSLLTDLNNMLDNGIKLIQARIKPLSTAAVEHFFEQAIPLCAEKGGSLLVNSAVKNVAKLNVEGIHLTAQDLMSLKQRPAAYIWVAASCHNLLELQHAEQIGVDFVVIAPVLATNTHPDADPLGWEKFQTLTSMVNLPVYALGGMKKQDTYTAQRAGAQGIAGISVFLG